MSGNVHELFPGANQSEPEQERVQHLPLYRLEEIYPTDTIFSAVRILSTNTNNIGIRRAFDERVNHTLVTINAEETSGVYPKKVEGDENYIYPHIKINGQETTAIANEIKLAISDNDTVEAQDTRIRIAAIRYLMNLSILDMYAASVAVYRNDATNNQFQVSYDGPYYRENRVQMMDLLYNNSQSRKPRLGYYDREVEYERVRHGLGYAAIEEFELEDAYAINRLRNRPTSILRKWLIAKRSDELQELRQDAQDMKPSFIGKSMPYPLERIRSMAANIAITDQLFGNSESYQNYLRTLEADTFD